MIPLGSWKEIILNCFELNQHNIKLFGFLFLKELRARFEFIWKELKEQDSI